MSSSLSLDCSIHGNLTELHLPLKFSHQRIVIGILYLFVYFPNVFAQLLCFIAICHKKHLQYSCYKLMSIVSCLDILNLTMCVLMPAIFSLASITHCEHAKAVYALTTVLYLLWYAYCAATVFLALNRCLEFASGSIARILFADRRAWFWLPAICLYAVTVEFTSYNAYYIYIPDGGKFNLQTVNDPPRDWNHIFNNIFKFVTVSVLYGVMWTLMKMKTKAVHNPFMSSMEKQLAIQALLVSVFAGFATVGYIIVENLPNDTIPFEGVLGTLLWASVHSASAWIYLLMNRSIRSTALRIFRVECIFHVSVSAYQSTQSRAIS